MHKQFLVIEASGSQTYVNHALNKDMKSRKETAVYLVCLYDHTCEDVGKSFSKYTWSYNKISCRVI